MLRVLKWIGIALLAIILVTVGTVYALSSAAFGKTYDVPDEPVVAVPADSASIARGEHLFKSTATCAECHGTDAGGTEMAKGGPFSILAAPNLTSGRGSVTAAFTPQDWERGIRHGVRADGTSLIVMPSEAFTYLTNEDLGAIIAYLEQAPPVDREFPRSRFSFLGRALLSFGQLPLLVAAKTERMEHVASIAPDTSARYGRYLASIGGCHGCHGFGLSGGRVAGPPDAPPASNLTPAGIGTWTYEDFARALREGRRPDGTELSTFMSWKVYADMTDDEVTALWTYVRSVPSKEFGGK